MFGKTIMFLWYPVPEILSSIAYIFIVVQIWRSAFKLFVDYSYKSCNKKDRNLCNAYTETSLGNLHNSGKSPSITLICSIQCAWKYHKCLLPLVNLGLHCTALV